MRVTLGVDYADTHAASRLMQRLRFRDAALDFTHVIPGSMWAPPSGTAMIPAEAMMTAEDVEKLTEQDVREASSLLATASATLSATGAAPTTTVLRGNATETLLRHADETHADLIAVNASREKPLMAMLTGSVARGLLIGANQSVLLARNYQPERGIDRPLRAVLATDHSAYMERCIEKLIRFMPLGIAHLTILSAFPSKDIAALKSRLPHLAVDPCEAIQHELESRNEALAQRLRDAFTESPTTVSTMISGESIDQAILLAMEETEADLLIVGAQGHSLLERLTIGSVSFRQAMAEPYSVLVVRLDPDEIKAIRGSDANST